MQCICSYVFPYHLQEAKAALAKYEMLVLVDVRRPVANFGYDGGPSQIIELEVKSQGVHNHLQACAL